MNKLITLSLLFFSLTIFAQAPINDDCNGIIDLGTAPYCPGNEFFTNVNATPSDFGTFTNLPTCLTSTNSPRDVWFQFTADATITDYEITVTGADDGTGSTPLNTPQLVLYRGFCQQDELIILDCVEASLGDSTATIKITGLTPGLTYFLRVGDYSPGAPNAGTFKLCIKEKSPEVTIDSGSSDASYGILYDSGGPDGDYGASENYVFTICPTDFHQCISFLLEYYNLEGFTHPITDVTKTDELIIFDGSDTLSPILAHLGGANAPLGKSTTPINDGAVCFQVYGSSGCITVQFKSDADVQFEGFKAIWETSQDPCPQSELITVDDQADTSVIVDYLNTAYAQTTIDTIICDNASYGSFLASDKTGLGIKKGLILTTGNALNAIGPNDNFGLGALVGTPGDQDLDSLSILLGNGTLSQDACVVELDVYAYSDKLSFEYIFGSEEYKEYVNSNFNDIFAFLVSGPGITGVPQLNNQQNIAVLPNTNTPVQINSVNQETNWQYYRNNDLGQSVQYDGLTSDSLGIKKSLTAQINVTPCNHYKLKLAIADRGDGAFDSGVFISEIKAGSPEIAVDFKSGLDYLVESCTTVDDILVIELNGEVQDTITYTVNVSGSAINGTDYILNIPGSLTFSPTQTKYSFPISIIDDNIIEGTEKIIISLSSNFGCGEVIFDDLVIDLKDNIDVNANILGDTLDVCINDGVQLNAVGAVTYAWTPANILDNPNIANPFANPTVSGWISVTGTAGICSNTDSVYLDVHDVQVTATTSDDGICLGDVVNLNSNTTIGNPTFTWSPSTGISDTSIQAPTATPDFSTSYIVQVEKFGCIAKDTVFIQVDTLFEPTLIPDTTICLGHSIQLGTPIVSTSIYSWNPTGDLDNPNSSAPLATPTNQTTIYTLMTTSSNGHCSAQQQVTVTTIPASLNVTTLPDMNTSDTIFLCAPDSTQLFAQTSTSGVGLSWLPANGTLSSQTDTIVTAKPIVSGLYVATLVVGQCTLHDSTYIQIDSLPDLALEAIPIKDPFCPGDTVSIFSENYDQDAFVGITHTWTPSTSIISDPNKFNLVIITKDTITYTRTTQIGACLDSASITLNVDHPADIAVTQDKDSICAGEQVQLTASASPDSNFVWTPTDGLSCSECPNPIATPSNTITYSVTLKDANCPSSETATIVVKESPSVQFPTDNNLCPSESITLNENNDPTITYSWTSDDPNFGTMTIAQPTVTPSVTTTYTVVTSNGSCENTQTITVNVANDELSIDGPDGVCPGYPITLTATTNGTGDYVWMPDNINSQSISVEPTTATTYSVTYTYGDGCTLAISKNIVVYQDYTVALTAEKDTVFSGEIIKLQATVNPTLTNPTFKWTQNGNDVAGTGASLAIKSTEGPVDEFVATLITPDGCEYPATISIVIKPLTYEIPNAFTPNNDGTNDLFKPAILVGYEFSKMQIFNRWGQLVYEGSSGWDGAFKNKALPSDAYPYMIELIAPDGSKKVLKGNVTLLR